MAVEDVNKGAAADASSRADMQVRHVQQNGVFRRTQLRSTARMMQGGQRSKPPTKELSRA
eukprot:4789846-Alexandrium_andersonii.AAC.1